MAGLKLRNSEVDSLSWFHPGVTRHQAESMLLHNGTEGSYLLRTSTQQQYTLSVRFLDSVKNFPIIWSGNRYTFGLASFGNFEEFKNHFENKPILKGTSGDVVCLRHPYPYNVEEPQIYDSISNQAELGRHRSYKEHPHHSVATKAGYLVKQGQVVKNWKRRWFVASHNKLRYYKKRDSMEPIKEMDMEQCTECTEDDSKDLCFRLVFPYRTFYLCASTEDERQEWIQLLTWKMDKVTFDDPVNSP